MWSLNNQTFEKVVVDFKVIEHLFCAEGLTVPIEFTLLSRQQISRVHSQFKGKNTPTDTLSFPPEEEGEQGVVLLCPEEINFFSRRYHLCPQLRWNHVVIHSALHIHHFDHQTQEDFKKMRALEQFFLCSLPGLESWDILSDYTYRYTWI